ncbi:MAG: GldG family protein [Gammaproteobacteria bacterium]|nr:GldG family protein [Gammaproteobacteria bacterium]
MRVTRKSRLQLRAQNWGFVVLFLAVIGLVAWLSTRYVYNADWTYGHRNSLSTASVQLLHTLKSPLAFTAYARDNAVLREAIRRFVGKYQEIKKDTTLTFINPDTNPQAVRSAGITADGELVIGYQGRSQHVTQINEAAVTNAIEGIARAADEYVVFLAGDGERNPLGQHNFDLGDFGTQLEQKGFKLETLNLAATPSIPINTAVLVIAGPQANLLPGAVKLIRDYVERGGNLLWLGDPGPLYGLEPLAQDLGITFAKGTIVDPDSQLFGITNPTVILVAKYNPALAITRDFNTATLFAGATYIRTDAGSGWQSENFLQTLPRSWLETGKLEGDIKFDPAHGDKPGPLTIGVSLTRAVKPPATSKDSDIKSIEQRVAVTGDGDFLSNSYLNNAGNLTLGLNILNWLAHEDSLININAQAAPDRTLALSKSDQSLIGLGFLFLIPLALVACGLIIWSRRRRA